MAESLFTKIINGDIPCHKVYEDELTFAFLDIHPRQPGHCLVVPKNPVEFVWDLPDEDYEAVMRTARLLALKLREAFAVPYVYASIVGTDVPHAHVHLIPFTMTDQLHGHDPELDDAALEALAAKIRLK